MEFATPHRVSQDQMLLHELNHRVNNEFTTAISVVSLAAARSGNDEVKAVLSRVAELLHQYADVHRALQVPQYDIILEGEMYLRQLCFSISRSYLDHRKIKLVLSTEPLQLRADRCWRLGMIVYELIINSARHALFGDAAEIRVDLSHDGEFVKCSITDNGSAVPAVQPGRGLKIVDELSKSLGGRFEQRTVSSGWRSIVIFPNDEARDVLNPQANLFDSSEAQSHTGAAASGAISERWASTAVVEATSYP